MTAIGGLLVPGFGLLEVHRHAAAQLVGLAEIELRIGIALGRRVTPFLDGLGEFAAFPGIDPGLDIGQRRAGQRDSRRCCSQDSEIAGKFCRTCHAGLAPSHMV